MRLGVASAGRRRFRGGDLLPAVGRTGTAGAIPCRSPYPGAWPRARPGGVPRRGHGREHDGPDGVPAGAAHRPRERGEGGTGGEDVVHEQDGRAGRQPSGDDAPVPGPPAALARAGARMGRRAAAPERARAGQQPRADGVGDQPRRRQRPGELGERVVAAPSESDRAARDRDEQGVRCPWATSPRPTMLATAPTKWNPTTHTETGPNNGGGPIAPRCMYGYEDHPPRSHVAEAGMLQEGLRVP